jgi:hypothetical protein
MILLPAVIALLDSILKLGLIYIQALPPAQQQQAALQVFADFNWWRKTFGLPVFTPSVTPLPATRRRPPARSRDKVGHTTRVRLHRVSRPRRIPGT